MEEVKAAQAESREKERAEELHEVHFSHDDASRPQRPSIPLYRKKKKKGLNELLKRILKALSFRAFKRKYSSSTAQRFRYLTFEEIKSAKESQELKESGWHSHVDPPRPETVPVLDLDPIPPTKHKHHRRRRRWKFRLFRKSKREVPPLIINPLEIRETDQEKVPFSTYIRPVLNSTALFIIAYQLSWFFYQFAVMLVASANKIDTVLYYYEVMFPIGNYSPKWNQTNIIFITLAGPLISLILALLYRYFFLKRFHPGAQMRQFLVWLYLNSNMLFFGAFVGGAITRQGFGYVVDWLYMNVAFRILFSMIFLILIIWISWKVVALLPEMSGKDSWKNNRYGFVLSRLVIPWFLGGTLLVLLKVTNVIPQHENIFNYDALNIATLMFAVVPPLFNSKTRPHLIQNRKTYPRVHRATVAVWIVIALLLIIAIRVGLSPGLYFKLDVSFDMGFYH